MCYSLTNKVTVLVNGGWMLGGGLYTKNCYLFIRRLNRLYVNRGFLVRRNTRGVVFFFVGRF
jgi:hypothetical protein